MNMCGVHARAWSGLSSSYRDFRSSPITDTFPSSLSFLLSPPVPCRSLSLHHQVYVNRMTSGSDGDVVGMKSETVSKGIGAREMRKGMRKGKRGRDGGREGGDVWREWWRKDSMKGITRKPECKRKRTEGGTGER